MSDREYNLLTMGFMLVGFVLLLAGTLTEHDFTVFLAMNFLGIALGAIVVKLAR